jgi:hypothetical protein
MNRTRRALAFYLGLLGMMVRALLPSGYMPAGTVASGISVVFCTAQGAQSKLLGLDGKPAKGGFAHSDQCPFGFALSMGGTASASLPSMPWFTRASTLVSRDPTSVVPDRARHTHRARAPPIAAA